MSALPTPLFAFNFAAPALLWGLALGTAPIIIHLLNRRKFREMQWAAMRFLLAAVRKNSRRLRIEQLVLLAVRTLLLLLLVFALAQPIVEQLGAFFQASQPTHRIVVIDASLSMGAQPRDVTLFDRARETARSLVEGARQGDAFQVARLSNVPPALVVSTPAFQPASVIEEIDQMQLPHGRGDLVACLNQVELLLKTVPDLPQKEIYLISDFQRATWTAETSDDAARLKALLRTFDQAGRIVLVDLGQAEAGNVAITGLESIEPFATTVRPTRFRATLHNYGAERVTGRVVEFLVDDRVVEQRAVEINAGAELVENFSHTFATPGERRVHLRLQRDLLALDDQRWLAVPVKERLRVLCVSGRSGGRGSNRATDFVELALSPFSDETGPAGALRGRVEPVVVNDGDVQGIDLAQYDCVFFCDVPLFTEREARQIGNYLRGGGGVVWCLGAQVRAENYNQTLFQDGQGLLPARLGSRRGGNDQADTAFAFDPDDFLHPIVNPFQGNPEAGLETTQTYTYIEAAVDPAGRARVALRFDSGDPAIVEAPVGEGRSVLITTSVDERWGVWPLWPSFLPLMHEVVQFAVSGRWGERQRLVGDSLSAVISATPIDVESSVTRPDGQILTGNVSTDDGVTRLNFDGTGTSGIYEVNFGHPLSRTELYAVNVDPRESNLVKFSPEELEQEVFAGIEFDYVTSLEERPVPGVEAPVPRTGGLTRWLLYAVLYLLFVEQMMAWDFRRGLMLLFPPLIPLALVSARRGAGHPTSQV